MPIEMVPPVVTVPTSYEARLAALEANLPSSRFIVAAAKTVGNTTTTTAQVDIPGLSVTFTAANARYRIEFAGSVFSNVAGDCVAICLCDPSNFNLIRTVVAAGANAVTSCYGMSLYTASAGPLTIKAQLVRTGGSGTVGHYCDGSTPSTLAVYTS